MLLLNFAHPLTDAHLARVGELAGRAVDRVIAVPSQFEHTASFVDQVRTLLDAASLNPEEWQTIPLLVNLPSFSPIAGALLAALHGRMGYFPTIVRLRPVPGSTPPQFEVAELINLQTVRDASRAQR